MERPVRSTSPLTFPESTIQPPAASRQPPAASRHDVAGDVLAHDDSPAGRDQWHSSRKKPGKIPAKSSALVSWRQLYDCSKVLKIRCHCGRIWA